MRMKDILFQVEELHDAGLSIEEIAKRLHIPVPAIDEMLNWISKYGSQTNND